MSRPPIESVVYFCPDSNSPAGGIKVILKHCELINAEPAFGLRSAIAFPTRPDFVIDWFAHAAPVRRDMDIDAETDFVVIPEIWALAFGPKLIARGIRFGIFVQNGYLIAKDIAVSDMLRLRAIYDAASLILSISADSTQCITLMFPLVGPKIVAVQYSIDSTLFHGQGGKTDTITYMPRKMAQHSDIAVKFLLMNDLKGWRIQPIHNMSEAEVAATLNGSKIFLSFSELEGVPVPPLEAAFAGNLVIGYTGEGGKEYWRDGVFTEVQSGDIRGLVAATLRTIARLADAKNTPGTSPVYRATLDAIRERYAPAAEKEKLATFITRLRALTSEPDCP
jgi:hypothetical protein